MKLTKLQRYTAYCIISVELDETGYEGFCKSIGENISGICGCDLIKQSLPELSSALFRINDNWQWETIFPKNKHGYNQRINIIQKCIEETHP